MNATPPGLQLFAMFVAVAEELSFSKAAGRLNVTKGTVSRAILRLEESVGAPLFYRTTHSVALSEAGRALYAQAAAPIRVLQDIGDHLPEQGEELKGELRIATSHDVGVVILPEILARFTERHPLVRLDVQIGNANVDLAREGIDLALRVSRGMLEDSALSVRRIGGFGILQMYASPAYLARRGAPRAVDDAAHDWAVFRHDDGGGPPPRFRVDDFLLLREIVRAGLAIGILPAFLSDPLVASGDLQRVLPSFVAQTRGGFFFVSPSRKRPPRKVVVFRELVLALWRDR